MQKCIFKRVQAQYSWHCLNNRYYNIGGASLPSSGWITKTENMAPLRFYPQLPQHVFKCHTFCKTPLHYSRYKIYKKNGTCNQMMPDLWAELTLHSKFMWIEQSYCASAPGQYIYAFERNMIYLSEHHC